MAAALELDTASASTSLQIGESMTVALRAIPGSGFLWALDGDAAPQVAVTPAGHEPMSPGVGGASLQKFSLRATAQGRAELVFKHWRSWEGERSVTERRRLQVHVLGRPAGPTTA